MTFEIYTPMINFMQPFEDTVAFDGTEALGAISSGSSRKLELRTYRGVRILGAELRIRKWNADDTVSTQYGLNLYCSYKTPDNVAEVAKSLTAPIVTNNAVAFAAGGGDAIIPLITDHLVDPTAATELRVNNGFGSLVLNNLDTTTGTVLGVPIINPLSHKFQEISFGIELTGGESGKSVICAGQLSVWGLCRGVDMPQVASGKASFVSWGDAVTRDTTNGNWDGTLPIEGTDDLDSETV